MSFELPTQRTVSAPRTRWSGTAFLIEAMLLLVFVMASLAVFSQLFAASADRANASRDLTDAVAVAATCAERFAADPMGVPAEFEQDGMRVVCAVTPQMRNGGTLYHADIDVYAPSAEDGEPTYSVSTAKYESGV